MNIILPATSNKISDISPRSSVASRKTEEANVGSISFEKVLSNKISFNLSKNAAPGDITANAGKTLAKVLTKSKTSLPDQLSTITPSYIPLDTRLGTAVGPDSKLSVPDKNAPIQLASLDSDVAKVLVNQSVQDVAARPINHLTEDAGHQSKVISSAMLLTTTQPAIEAQLPAFHQLPAPVIEAKAAIKSDELTSEIETKSLSETIESQNVGSIQTPQRPVKSSSNKTSAIADVAFATPVDVNSGSVVKTEDKSRGPHKSIEANESSSYISTQPIANSSQNQTQESTSIDLTTNIPSISSSGVGLPAVTNEIAASSTKQTVSFVTPDIGSSEWGKAFAQQVSVITKAGVHNAEMQINPPGMGPIKITLSMSNHQMQASFSSENSFVRAAVEAALPQLRATLSDNGINLGQTMVNSESQRQQAAFADNQSNRPPNRGYQEATKFKDNGSSPTHADVSTHSISEGLKVDTYA